MDSRQRRTVVAVVVLVGGLACLIAVMLGRGIHLYMGVDELIASGDQYVNREMRLAGFVAEPPAMQADGSARFAVEARGATVPVAFTGSLPANLEPSREVLLDGRLGADGVFRAHTLLTQCSSRYRRRIDAPAAPADGSSPRSETD